MAIDVPIDNDLLRVISAASDRPAAFTTHPEQLTGGFWATIYGFELEPGGDGDDRFAGPLVLRVMPEASVAGKETIVQTALGAAGYATPRVVLSGHDEPLGGAFMVMARAPGNSPMSGLSIGPSPVRLIRSLRSIPVLLGETAARLHAIDPNPIDAALRDAGIELAPLGDEPYRRDICAAMATSAVGFGEVLRWFDEHQPAMPRRVVCHGDLHPLNLLVADDATVTVLDWTNATICPPELDVGFTTAFLRCAPISVPAVARPVLRAVTGHLARRFQQVYRAQPHAPLLDPSRLRWYEALQYARCLADTAVGRTDPNEVVGADHPFETAARDMTRELAAITGITITLPERTGLC